MALEIKHVVLAETLGEPFSQSSQGISNGSDLKPLDAWWTKDDPGVGLLSADGILGEDNKVASISGHQAPTHSRRIGELLPVRKLNVPRLESANRVKSPLAEPLGNSRREILIQVELHAVRTKPGSLALTAS